MLIYWREGCTIVHTVWLECLPVDNEGNLHIGTIDNSAIIFTGGIVVVYTGYFLNEMAISFKVSRS